MRGPFLLWEVLVNYRSDVSVGIILFKWNFETEHENLRVRISVYQLPEWGMHGRERIFRSYHKLLENKYYLIRGREKKWNSH